MAGTKIAAAASQGKREVRSKLTDHEIDLIQELVELYGWRGAADRLEAAAR